MHDLARIAAVRMIDPQSGRGAARRRQRSAQVLAAPEISSGILTGLERDLHPLSTNLMRSSLIRRPTTFRREAMQKECASRIDRQLSAVHRAGAAAHPERQCAGDAQRNGKVSVVVPGCGRADLLNRCLSALAAFSALWQPCMAGAGTNHTELEWTN